MSGQINDGIWFTVYMGNGKGNVKRDRDDFVRKIAF